MKDSAIVAVFFVASFPALVGLTIPTKKPQTYLTLPYLVERMLMQRMST